MLFDRIKNELNLALKAHEENRVSLLRLLVSEIKNFEINSFPPGSTKSLSDEDVLTVIKKMAKTHRESIEMFEKGNRDDLVAKEKFELEMLLKYLPELLGREEIRKEVKEAIKEISETDFGKIMGKTMAKLSGRADGKMVGEIVKEELEAIK